MPLDLDSLPPLPEYTDAQAFKMTTQELLHAPAIFHHAIDDDGDWTVTPENAPAKEILRRLNAWWKVVGRDMK
jgi:hypothetical protein